MVKGIVIKMENHINSAECTGCTACYGVCPKDAISMKVNKEGFISSFVKVDKCVNCGLCRHVCPLENGIMNIDEVPQLYVGYSKEESQRMQSASGGVFFQIAKFFIEKHNAIVFGATMNRDMEVFHIGITTVEDLNLIRGSKYVQSDLKKSFEQTKRLLEDGRWVLFSGVACQINGLKRYLSKHYDRLFTVDLICHGIPSHTMFIDYVKFLERKKHKKIVDYKFRQKHGNEKSPSYDTKIFFEDNTEILISGDDDIYTINYLQNDLQNNACFRCPFTSIHRDGDITLGDYWGIDKVHPEIRVNGTSLVIVNSKAGKLAIRELLNDIELLETTEDKVRIANRQLYFPPAKGKKRDELYNKYGTKGFSDFFYYTQFVGKNAGIYIMKRKIKSLIRIFNTVM